MSTERPHEIAPSLPFWSLARGLFWRRRVGPVAVEAALRVRPLIPDAPPPPARPGE